MMNKIRRLLGYVWIALGLFAGYYLIVYHTIPKLKSGSVEDIIPGIIYLLILTPVITGGLCLFGYFAIKGEYDYFKDDLTN
ncbi:MAG: hypothetical protein QM528_02705 [Phycisphaerales bacterium]|nr:hypothetical protein [Phycisphaerales bacterium]